MTDFDFLNTNKLSLSSFSGLIDLLNEKNVEIVENVLKGLLKLVDTHWHEISEGLLNLETILDSVPFSLKRMAALLIAKINYHLEMYDRTLQYILLAEDLFDPHELSEFALSCAAKALEKYFEERQKLFDQVAMDGSMDDLKRIAYNEKRENDPLELLVERVIRKAYISDDMKLEQEVLGTVFESRRLDLVKEVILKSNHKLKLLSYCLERSFQLESQKFRGLLYQLIIELYEGLDENKFTAEFCFSGYIKVLYLADEYSKIAEYIHGFLTITVPEIEEEAVCIAYQCAFDLVTYENQKLQLALLNDPLFIQAADEKEQLVPIEDIEKEALLSNSVISPLKATDRLDDTFALGLTLQQKINRLRRILSGDVTLEMGIEFLHRVNKTDLSILDTFKKIMEYRTSLSQNGLIICHAFMQAGTTCDVFVKKNLDWLGQAAGWSKFLLAASAGVLQRGHLFASQQVLAAYLPGSSSGPYAEGGGLYGLGLIRANRFDTEIKNYLLTQLAAAKTHFQSNYEPLQHGACLGLGLMAMGTNEAEIYAALKDILFGQSSVAGEAAALAMGLVYLESRSENVFLELYNHAQETPHDRIIRQSSLGAAFIYFRCEKEADPYIEMMIGNLEPMIRYGGMFAIGLAYCGTCNTDAIKKLLYYSVMDVSMDVRRAAVISLGFIINDPNKLLSIIQPLITSYNPYVRYGAVLAIGIGCAGTGLSKAVNMLYPIAQDSVDFVRQGALLGLGLVLVEAPASSLPGDKVNFVRSLIMRIVVDKHEDVITRFGAVVAQGLLDAGGQNCTITLYSSTGFIRREAAVGLIFLSQLWFWHPLVLAGALAFRPTALIGLTCDLLAPLDFEVSCDALPEKFAYIEPYEHTKKIEKKEATTAVLSTTKRRKQHEQLKKLAAEQASRSENTEMSANVDSESSKNKISKPKSDTEKQTDEKSEVNKVTDSIKPNECLDDKKPKHVIMSNLCRVIPGVESHINLNVPSSNWIPVDLQRSTGIVMLKQKFQLD